MKTRSRNGLNSFNAVTASCALIALLTGSHSLAAEKLWQIDNLDQPESVVVDSSGQTLFISNINGQPLELNGQGYISRADTAGRLLQKHWVTGLDAPKGMAISEGRLYIADMQQVHIVDIDSGRIIKQLKAVDAKMLNDVTAAPDGSVYISDMLGGAIYRIQDQQLKRWFSSEKLPHPNGLLWHKDNLLVAGWGYPMKEDFTTNTLGSLYRLDSASRSLTTVTSGYRFGNLDGIVAQGERLLVSDWISGELFQLNGKERHRVIAPGAGLADIGGQGNMIYAPMMMDNRVVAWQTRED